MSASFRKPVFPGDLVTLEMPHDSAGSIDLRITSLGEVKATVEGQFSRTQAASSPAPVPHPEAPASRDPRILADEELAGREGELALHLPETEYGHLFPNLARWMEPLQASALLSISRLIGVECPGLNSILHGITLTDRHSPTVTNLDYSVTAFDNRMRQLSMAVESPLLSGSIIAFVRPEPVAQADCSELSLLVEDNEFSDQDALVIGASRGLGELTAKLLAMGGATVTGTFNLGIDDANRVTNETNAAGGNLRFIHLDITQDDFFALSAKEADLNPTHLYYFCSPRIPMDQTGALSVEILRELFQIYVVRFVELAVLLAGPHLSHVFYPSTVALEDTPLGMREYSIAKSAGEAACTALEKTYPNLRIYRPRLPRMITDQTASILPTRTEKSPTQIVTHLRELSTL